MAKSLKEALEEMPILPVLEDTWLDSAEVNGRWFVAKLHPRKVQATLKAWKIQNPERKLKFPTNEELSRELFDAFCFEARKEGFIGAFVWCGRLDMGFVEVPTAGCVDGFFKEPLANIVVDRKVAFFTQPRLIDICRRHHLFIERELEMSRHDVTKAVFGKEYLAREVFEKIEGKVW